MKPDDLDRLFAGYYRQQLPDPFPPCRATANAEPSTRRHSGSSTTYGRLTLAASVAALLGLGLTVTSGPKNVPAVKSPTPPNGGLLNGATADGKVLQPKE